jgi:ornithine decarboxylase
MTMTATYADFSASFAVPSARIEGFIAANRFERPTLVLDIDRVEQQYRDLAAGLGPAMIHYAVKANPAPEIIDRLISLGSHFDAASRGEIELCLGLGAHPETISFGNTVKRVSDIAFAHRAGITMFAADASEEIEKIAAHAPGAEVYIRLLVEASGADWPLTRKFGTTRDTALALMAQARDLGLRPAGLSFHVGSQTRDPAMWGPAFYGEAIPHPTAYAAAVMAQVAQRFPEGIRIMAEPGRGLVAEAGMIAAEVLLVARKSDDDLHRWVYLDIGKFSGLAETMDEAIRYQFVTPHDGEATGPCILAGPSCDSADVLYEKRPVSLPLALKSGDRVLIRNCGAYTSSYSSVGFNGFPPLDVVVI